MPNNTTCDGYNTITVLLYIILFALLIHLCFAKVCGDDVDKNNTEPFGALQSLYSNDGIADAYLTIENDPDDPANHDPYSYWRGVTWNLPTRNLNQHHVLSVSVRILRGSLRQTLSLLVNLLAIQMF